MPAAVSLAASFDPALARDYGQVVGAEERAKGAMVNLGPTVNIDRDPRWGRSFEAFTEDPDLNAAMAVADIDGVQSQDEMSQIKHLAVYNQETNRNTSADDAIVSQQWSSARHLPAEPHAGPRVKPEPIPGRKRPGRLLRGDRRRLPLLRREPRDPAVPVRLRPVLHQVQVQAPDRQPRVRP